MRSLIRRRIENFAVRKNLAPHYIGSGQVFITPGSELGSYYLVTRTERTTKKGTRYVEWACACKGFRFSHKDVCKHITNIRGQWQKLEAKGA